MNVSIGVEYTIDYFVNLYHLYRTVINVNILTSDTLCLLAYKESNSFCNERILVAALSDVRA